MHSSKCRGYVIEQDAGRAEVILSKYDDFFYVCACMLEYFGLVYHCRCLQEKPSKVIVFQ